MPEHAYKKNKHPRSLFRLIGQVGRSALAPSGRRDLNTVFAVEGKNTAKSGQIDAREGLANLVVKAGGSK